MRVALVVAAEFEVLVLDNTGVGGLAVGVVYHGDALVVLLVENLAFKSEAAVLERSKFEVVERVDGPAVDGAVGDVRLLGDEVAVFDAGTHLDTLEHALDHLGVATHGDALVAIIEIVVVVGEAAGETLDDGGREVLAVAAPLLLGVAFYKLLENVATDE